MHFTLGTKTGTYDLQAAVQLIGGDLVITIWGGEIPHIGAVAVAQPRPSLRDPRQRSATASVICLLGHKEDALAKQAAETLAAALNANVVVTAGMHWKEIDAAGVQQVAHNGEQLVTEIIARVAALRTAALPAEQD